MDRFYYEKPSLKRKDEIIEFLDEFKNYNSISISEVVGSTYATVLV